MAGMDESRASLLTEEETEQQDCLGRHRHDSSSSSSLPLCNEDNDNDVALRRQRRLDLMEPLLSSSAQDGNDDGNSQSYDSDSTGSRHHPVSRNVQLTLIFTAFAFAGRSIWNQSVLATMVYLLNDGNPEAVGYITAAMGLSQLLASFPSGYLADSFRRDTLLKASSVVGVAAILATFMACWHANYVYLVVALSIWGIFWGMSSTAMQALFADSIPSGERSKYFTRRSIIIQYGNTFGFLSTLFMFVSLGDKWTIHDCTIVIAVGQLICLPAMGLLCFFGDDYTVTNQDIDSGQTGTLTVLDSDESVSVIESMESGEEGSTETINEREEERQIRPCDRSCNVITDGPHSDSENGDTSVDTPGRFCGGIVPEDRIIPLLVAAADLSGGLAAGMSIRYFPIFFYKNLSLSPVAVQVVYVVTPVGLASFMFMAQKVGKRFGRIRTTVAFKWTGIALMLLMVSAYTHHMPTWFVCALYIFRTAFMNSCSPLTRSVLMDNVPSDERGKWAALESVNMFSWSGSAALGGVLVHIVGILTLFRITALTQFLSSLFLVLLVALGKDTIE